MGLPWKEGEIRLEVNKGIFLNGISWPWSKCKVDWDLQKQREGTNECEKRVEEKSARVYSYHLNTVLVRAGTLDRIQTTVLIENQMTEKNDQRTENTKNWKIKSTVMYLIFGPIYI